MSCPTCKSNICGNHAACARRHAASDAWLADWRDEWAKIGWCANLVIRVREKFPEKSIEEIVRTALGIQWARDARGAFAELFFRGRRG